MGCSGSKDGGTKSPRNDDPPPISPSMQAIEGMDDLDNPGKTDKTDTSKERCDPDERRFPSRDASSIQAGSKGKARLKNNGSLLLVMSYRLLSENSLQSLDHSCPAFAASWDYRKRRILKEIAENKPDVLCLQGVDDYGFFEKELLEQGLTGIFEVTKANKDGEGCAVFVRHPCLKIAKTFNVKDVGVAALVMGSDSHPEEDTGIIVVSAWFHDECVDGGNMADCIDTALKDENFKRHSLIIAGEMGLPDSSFVQNAVDVPESTYGLADLKSAYENPPYTVCSNKQQAVTDYILYQTDQLQVVGTLAMCDAGAVKAANCLPNEDWPSSHASLLAMVEIITPVTVLKKSPLKSAEPDLIQSEDCPITPN